MHVELLVTKAKNAFPTLLLPHSILFYSYGLALASFSGSSFSLETFFVVASMLSFESVPLYFLMKRGNIRTFAAVLTDVMTL